MQVTDMINNLNLVFENLFKSVEGEVFVLLDKIIIFSPNILDQEPLKYIFTSKASSGMVIIANSLIIFQVLYYVFEQLLTLYNGNKNENIYVFIIKIICITVVVNNSYFICSQILEIIDAFTNSISLFSKQIAGQDVSFENLKENIIIIDDFMKSDLFSVNGLIKGIISFGSISVLINFSIRYVKIILLIIISPIALVCFSSSLTIEIANNWVKMLVTSLLLQVIIKIILLIPIAYKDVDSFMYKIVLVGSIQLIYSINNINLEIFSKISNRKNISNIYQR